MGEDSLSPRVRPATGLLLIGCVVLGTATASMQQARNTPAAAVEIVLDYVIGPDDVLSIVFWRDKELSSEVTVRPDGKISLPLLNDIMAAGLTPDQLRARILQSAEKFVEDAQATVVVKEIKSRRVFITGQVEKPGTYPLTSRTTVLQLIAMAGGIRDYAKSSKIVVMRNAGRSETRFMFDYNEVVEGKNIEQNIELKPGDTVVVP